MNLSKRAYALGLLGSSMPYSLQVPLRGPLGRSSQALHQLHEVLAHIPAWLTYCGRDLRVQFANHTALQWAGLTSKELPRKSLCDLLGPRGFAQARPYIDATLDGEPHRYGLNFTDASNIQHQVDMVHVPDHGERCVDGFFLVATEVTRPHGELALLRRLAYRDALTDLPNRRAFDHLLEQAHKRALREGSWLAVLFVDIDEFKSINDTYGHAVGDAALQAFGATLHGAVRAADVVARRGGDEFTVLLEDLATPGALHTVIRNVEAAFVRPMPVNGHELVLHASVGAALSRGADCNPETLLAEADAAMYQAKHYSRPSLVGLQPSVSVLEPRASDFYAGKSRPKGRAAARSSVGPNEYNGSGSRKPPR